MPLGGDLKGSAAWHFLPLYLNLGSIDSSRFSGNWKSEISAPGKRVFRQTRTWTVCTRSRSWTVKESREEEQQQDTAWAEGSVGLQANMCLCCLDTELQAKSLR